MTVGRTLWDFILEVMQTPWLRAAAALAFSGDSVPRDAADGVQRLYGAEYKLWRL
jgi:hypothetical protein